MEKLFTLEDLVAAINEAHWAFGQPDPEPPTAVLTDDSSPSEIRRAFMWKRASWGFLPQDLTEVVDEGPNGVWLTGIVCNEAVTRRWSVWIRLMPGTENDAENLLAKIRQAILFDGAAALEPELAEKVAAGWEIEIADETP